MMKMLSLAGRLSAVCVLVCVFAVSGEDILVDTLSKVGMTEFAVIDTAAISVDSLASAEGVSALVDTDTASVHRLFGDDVGEAVDSAIILPPFEGDFRVLISRPVYAAYDREESEAAWVSAAAEVYMYYRVASLPRVYMFGMEEVAGAFPMFDLRSRGRHISREHYVEAGRRLGATHVIYQEYLPLNGDSAYYAATLYRMAENAVEALIADTVVYADFERSLGRVFGSVAAVMMYGAAAVKPITVAVADTLAVVESDTVAVAESDTSAVVELSVPAAVIKLDTLTKAILGGNRNAIEALGNALVIEDAFIKERSAAAYVAVERFVRENPDFAAANYAAALLANRAQNYERAVERMSAVINGYGGAPPLWQWLPLAAFLRAAGWHGEAVKSAEAAASEPALKTAALVEKAMIFKARGDTAGARDIYESLIVDGSADGRVFFRLALMYAQAGNIVGSEEALAVAARREISLLSGEYFELGLAYGAIKEEEKKAVEYIIKSMGINQNDERAWIAIADIHNRAQNLKLYADALINLFKINPQKYTDMIKTAGGIYEELGLFDEAKDIYRLFLAREFFDRDVSLALARIYINEKNCAMMMETLNRQNLFLIPEAGALLRECGFRVVNNELAAKSAKPTLRYLRISTGVLAVGGTVAGALFNGAVVSEGAKYKNYAPEGLTPKNSDAENYDKVIQMRKNIDNYTTYRNLSYIFGALCAAGFAVTFWF